jgi:DUF1365 family protein
MTGWVSHRRFSPIMHGFKYKVMMLYLDLDEQSEVFSHSRLWSDTARWALAKFDREYYLGGNKQAKNTSKTPTKKSIKDSVIDCINTQTGEDFKGSVRLLTNAKYFGFIVNPISVYYCFEHTPDGEKLVYSVLEVTNTPWNEKVQYVIKVEGERKHSAVFEKAMHVSPFNDSNMDYHWFSCTPKDTINIHLSNVKHSSEDKKPFFDATLKLNAHPINQSQLNNVLLAYPFMTLKVMGAIYWQAMRLLAKRLPFVSHPNKN